MAVRFYAVAVGRKTGIFDTWIEAEAQVKGHSGAKYKSFALKEDAEKYMDQHAASQIESVRTLDTGSQADVDGAEPHLNAPEPPLASHNGQPGGVNAMKNEEKNGQRSAPMSSRRRKANRAASTTPEHLIEPLKQLELKVTVVAR